MNEASLPPPSVDGPAGFAAALRWGFEQAVAQGARRILCVDPDWAGWPWDDLALQERLTAWLRQPGRRLVLLAERYDDVPARFPRFTAWRRPWLHAIEAWAPCEGFGVELPTLLVDDRGLCVELLERGQWRGRAAVDAARAGAWCERIDALLQRCEPAFGASPLGL